MKTVVLGLATSADDICEVRGLFVEYAGSLGFSLGFQGFDQELAGLPGAYALPTGRLLLARVDGVAAGCIGLRRIGEGVCEMKRLFVRPQHHGTGLGRRLAMAVIDEGRRAGYATMKLDTLPSMAAAIGLYQSLGFRDATPYTNNPLEGARFMELILAPHPSPRPADSS
jgi:ribosomal protein S18 acetylase RimI-like enzyme